VGGGGSGVRRTREKRVPNRPIGVFAVTNIYFMVTIRIR